MGDILKIIRCGTISVQRGCDGCDRHPVSAMRAFDAVSADTRQLERHEQAIEILYQPPADECECAAGSPMQLGERSNQRCRHRDALGRCRDVTGPRPISPTTTRRVPPLTRISGTPGGT
jgi:hypothetical protein